VSAFVPVARAADVPPGTGTTVMVGARAVALFNLDGEFHALDGVCLHRGGPVGEGDVDDGVVTCPWHGWQYEVATGRNVLDRSIGLAKHDARVEEGTVFVALRD
jgi:nitrite reductase/ring-hydroxylating ferredoxin subunit